VSDLTFEPVTIHVPVNRGRALRVKLDASGWTRVDLAVLRSMEATKPDAAVEVSADGVEELLHALEAVAAELRVRRERWLASEAGVLWSKSRSQVDEAAG
jgi:hypothetical protein